MSAFVVIQWNWNELHCAASIRTVLFYEVNTMPYKQRTQCRHPGCPVLIPVGRNYCNTHRRQYKETVRSAAERGYTSRWQRISKQYLRQHPLCTRCGRPAQVVDHIVPHRGREQLFWDERNWQALCKACHDKKTGKEDSRPTYEY